MLDEFLTGDSNLPVCLEAYDDNWQNAFSSLKNLGGGEGSQQDEADEDIR